MKKFNTGDKVWVNTGVPAYEPDGCFVGIVEHYVGTMPYVRNLLTGIGSLQKEEWLSRLVPCPIDDAANLQSDWIEEELIRHSYNEDGIGYGWIDDSCKVPCPVMYNVTRGMLSITRYNDNERVFDIAIEVINDLFNCEPKSDIVASCEISSDVLVVKFYYFEQ